MSDTTPGPTPGDIALMVARVIELAGEGKDQAEINRIVHDEQWSRERRRATKRHSQDGHLALKAWVAAPDYGEDD